jgi:exonuclease VII small subunit
MAKKKMDKDFGKAFAELDETAAWFERGEPDVEEGLKRFATAMETAAMLKGYLQDAQNRVNEIRAASSLEKDEENS